MKPIKLYTVFFLIFISFSELYSEKIWVQVKVPEPMESFEMLNCLDSNNCFAIGALSRKIIIYKSTNQGKVWNKVNEKYDDIVNKIYNISKCSIIDSNHIYIRNIDKVALEITTDGGKTFKTVLFGDLSEDKTEYFYDITMFTNQIGAGLTRSYLIFTTDNWTTYKIIKLPESVYPSRPLFFIDSNNIAFEQYTDYNNDFLKYDITNRKWSIWSRSELIVDEDDRMDALKFVNDTLGYSCGGRRINVGDLANDIVWKTTDRGKTWTKLMDQLNDPGFGMNQVAFRNEQQGIAIGSYGKIFETTDGGESWFQHPIQDNMTSWSDEVEWAGSTPLVAFQGRGIFRLETITEVEELSSDDKFRVYQSGRNLEIAINDESHTNYSFQLFNGSGQQILTRQVKSSFGFVFEPVQLIDLNNGVYYYTITNNNSVEFSGKLVVVE